MKYRYTAEVGRVYETPDALWASEHAGQTCEVTIRGNNRDQGAVVRFGDGFETWASWDELEVTA